MEGGLENEWLKGNYIHQVDPSIALEEDAHYGHCTRLIKVILTGREHGLSSTTSSSDKWITSIGLESTGVSCL